MAEVAGRGDVRSAVACSGLVYFAAVVWTGYHVGLNDFWGNVKLAQSADWSSPASFYNQFFPLGYTVFLKIAGASPVVPADLLSLAAGVWLLTIVGRLSARLLGESCGVPAVLAMAAHPLVFRYATTPGPDIVVAALVAAGFDRLFRATESDHRSAWLAGLLFGLAALFRYHALVFAAAAIAARLVTERRLRPVLLTAAGLFMLYLPQMIVSVLAGQGPLHTGQAYIFYKLMHPVNWFQVTTTPVPTSVMGVVMAEPRAFALAYLRVLQPLWPLPLSAAALAAFSRDRDHRRFGRAALTTIVLYLLVIAAGGSSRGSLPAIFLVVVAIVALARDVSQRGRSRAPRGVVVGVVAGVAMVWSLLWLRDDYGTVKYRAIDHASFATVQAILERDGVKASSQVFASDFSIYFPSMAGSVPRTNGTWLRIGRLPDDPQFPELCVESVECFVRDARRQGVTHVVLTRDAGQASAALGRVAAGDEADAFEPLSGADGFAVFRVR